MRFQAKNPWGQIIEAQRADLWQLDMSQVVQGLVNLSTLSESAAGIVASNPVISLEGLSLMKRIIHYYAQSIEFPKLTVNPITVMRASRPYQMPGYDEALGEIQIKFLHDLDSSLSGDVRRSRIYTLLQAWRGLVRAGRGQMSQEIVWSLDSDFKPPKYRYDIGIRFMAGVPYDTNEGQDVRDSIIADASRLTDAVEGSSLYVLKKAWLANLSLGTASMDRAELQTIEATLYAEDLQLN